jgi:undecaprenyl-diphosphatase
MLEQELALERSLFFFLNGHHTAFGDGFFWLVSYKWAWVPFYACLLFVFVYRKNWKEIVLVLLSIVLVITLCDQISAHVARPFFQRLRPTHHPDFQYIVQTVRDYRGGLYGFFSSHAANAFGLAVFTSLLFKNRWFTGTMLLFAFLTGYSRIYLGVHFVSDVVVGAAVGSAIAWGVYKVYAGCRQWWLGGRRMGNRKGTPYAYMQKFVYSQQEIYGLCIAFVIFLAIFLIFSCISQFFTLT